MIPASTRRSSTYTGNGGVSTYSFAFKVYVAADIAVKVTDLSGVETTLVQNTDYTVSLNGNQDTTPGGSITLTAPLATDYQLVVVGATPYTQDAQLPNGGAYNAAVVEQALDRLAMQIQQLREITSRQLTLPASADDVDAQLPEPQPNTVIGWDSLRNMQAFNASQLGVAVSYANWQTEVFNGGSTTYTLLADAGSASNIDLRVNNVPQTPGVNFSYTPSTKTITFLTGAPPAGTGVVVARYGQSLPQGTIGVGAVTPANMSGVRFGFRNRVINGKMEVSQRGTSFVSPASGTYTLDRWYVTHTMTGAVTVAQVALGAASNEFGFGLRVRTTTANASVSAGHVFVVGTRLEGGNVRDLIGAPVAISFLVSSPKSGLHCGRLSNSSFDRSYVFTFTVNTPNTLERKTITIPAGLITAGGWDYSVAGLGLAVEFALMAGTTLQTTAGEWQTGNFVATAGVVNCLDTINNDFIITGVQVEQSDAATPFEHRHYGQELTLCQRYYETGTLNVRRDNATTGNGQTEFITFTAVKRTTPNVTLSGGTTVSVSSDAVRNAYPNGFAWAVTNSATGYESVGRIYAAAAEL